MRRFNLSPLQEISRNGKYENDGVWDVPRYKKMIEVIYNVFADDEPTDSVKTEIVIMAYHFVYHQCGLGDFIKFELNCPDIGDRLISDVERNLKKLDKGWKDINLPERLYHHGCFFMSHPGRGEK